MYCATCGTSSTMSRRVWSLDAIRPTIPCGPSAGTPTPESSATGRQTGYALTAIRIGPLAARTERAELVVAGQHLDDEPGVLGERRAAPRPTPGAAVATDPAPAGPPWPPPRRSWSSDHGPGRGVVLGRAGLGHDRAGLGVAPRPLEDDPAVVPGEVLGIGQPDVDGRHAARGEVVGEGPERRPLGAARSARISSELRAMKARPNVPGIGQAQPDQVGLDERRSGPCRPARPPRRGVARESSIAGSRSTAVTRSPARRGARRAGRVPAASSRIGPPVRSASARYRSRSPGSSTRSRS